MSLSAPLCISEFLAFLETKAPQESAEPWDAVGLICGDPQQLITGIVISIDLTEHAIQQAIQHNWNCILTHHPCLFSKNPLTQLLAHTPLFKAIQKGIAVIACHTNFDQCALEVLTTIASQLNIQPQGRFLETRPTHPKPLLKLVTFVPPSHLERLRMALSEAGAGEIGQYRNCSFSVLGEGTFQGDDTTHPFQGNPTVLEKIPEIRFETIFPQGLQKRVLSALFKTHPYEEVAYDLYPLNQPSLQAYTTKGIHFGLGYGFWGDFLLPQPFETVAQKIKQIFNLNSFRITSPSQNPIQRLGFVAGKGAAFLEAALATHCDLLITGEVGYHLALQSSQQGMSVIELGHPQSEKFFTSTIKHWISDQHIPYIEIQIPTQMLWLEEVGPCHKCSP